MRLNNAQLEQLCVELVANQDAAGVVLLILNKQARAEIVAAFTEAEDDLPGKLRRLADEVESGGGMPLGNHLRTVQGK